MSAHNRTFQTPRQASGSAVNGSAAGSTFANFSWPPGESDQFQSGTPAHVNQACEAAERRPFGSYALFPTGETRADFLETPIADEMEARAEDQSTGDRQRRRMRPARSSSTGEPWATTRATPPLCRSTSAKARI